MYKPSLNWAFFWGVYLIGMFREIIVRGASGVHLQCSQRQMANGIQVVFLSVSETVVV
jgi:hypothetical protein